MRANLSELSGPDGASLSVDISVHNESSCFHRYIGEVEAGPSVSQLVLLSICGCSAEPVKARPCKVSRGWPVCGDSTSKMGASYGVLLLVRSTQYE